MQVAWKLAGIPAWGDAALVVVGSDRGLARVELLERLPERWRRALSRARGGVLGGAAGSALVDQSLRELREYLSGSRREFSVPLALADPVLAPDLPGFLSTDAARASALDRAVWSALLEVPFGALSSYSDIGERIGLGRAAARAVGGAVGRNPLPIIIPCHRIVGASGTLTGFSAGLPLKVRLLEHEGVRIERRAPRSIATWRVVPTAAGTSAAQQLELFASAP